MNKNEAITAIKNATKAITMLFSTKEEEAEFEAVKRVDSDELVDVQGELVPGTAVVTSTAMGSQEAADDTYSLANGVEFSTIGGKIDKVIKKPVDEATPVAEDPKEVEGTPEEEATETPAEETKEDAPVAEAPEAPTSTAALQTLVDKITEMDSMISAIKAALDGKASAQAMSVLGDQFNEIKGAFEVLSDTPAEFSKVDKSLEAKQDKANKLNALASIWK